VALVALAPPPPRRRATWLSQWPAVRTSESLFEKYPRHLYPMALDVTDSAASKAAIHSAYCARQSTHQTAELEAWREVSVSADFDQPYPTGMPNDAVARVPLNIFAESGLASHAPAVGIVGIYEIHIGIQELQTKCRK